MAPWTPQQYLIELRADIDRMERQIAAKPTIFSGASANDPDAVRENLRFYKELLIVAEANVKAHES
jgi:hypothetical protein